MLVLPLVIAIGLAASLDDAEAALTAGDVETCGKLAQEALSAGDLDEIGVVRAWTVRGKCFVKAGDLDRAERSYAVALRVKPDMADVDDDAFRSAKRALPKLPGLQFRAAGTRDVDTLEVELLGDDLLLIKGARVMRGDDEIARFPLEAGQAKHRVSGLGDLAGLVAVVVDKHGNALARIPVAAKEIVITPEPVVGAGRAPTMLTTIGATAIGAGIVGVVASGIGFASLGDEALKDEGQLWLVGVGASTGIFLIGAGMVVVDQGL